MNLSEHRERDAVQRGRLVAEEERLIGQHVRKDLQVLLAELLNFCGCVHAHALGLDFLGALKCGESAENVLEQIQIVKH